VLISGRSEASPATTPSGRSAAQLAADARGGDLEHLDDALHGGVVVGHHDTEGGIDRSEGAEHRHRDATGVGMDMPVQRGIPAPAHRGEQIAQRPGIGQRVRRLRPAGAHDVLEGAFVGVGEQHDATRAQRHRQATADQRGVDDGRRGRRAGR